MVNIASAVVKSTGCEVESDADNNCSSVSDGELSCTMVFTGTYCSVPMTVCRLSETTVLVGFIIRQLTRPLIGCTTARAIAIDFLLRSCVGVSSYVE